MTWAKPPSSTCATAPAASRAISRRTRSAKTAYAGIADLDLGDFSRCAAPLFRTRTGEITVDARELTVLAKALRPPPEKWHGLKDIETALPPALPRPHVNDDARERLPPPQPSSSRASAASWTSRGFIEVETPVLHARPAAPRREPFITHHNALDQDFYLRIALELYLKRLIVGGFERSTRSAASSATRASTRSTTPSSRCWRATRPTPTTTTSCRMVEEMVAGVAQESIGTTQVPYGEHTIDLTPPWRRITMRDALIEHAGIDFEEYRDARVAATDVRTPRASHAEPGLGWGKLHRRGARASFVEPQLVQPTFLIDYPMELSPLAKRKPDAPGARRALRVLHRRLRARQRLHELNDPHRSARALPGAGRLRAAGDDEAELLDEDFLVALEHGMPPTGGLGIGIDRLVMVLTDRRPSAR